MFKNYLKLAGRNLIKHKTHSSINIMGLAIGIAACLMIALYVKDELTFDAYHQDADRIYRVGLKVDDKERGEASFARSSPALANALKEECSSVELAIRLADIWGAVVKNSNGDLFFETGTIHSADPDFFNMFTIPLIHGNKHTVFDQPNNIVLSEATAFKYFGRTNVLGELLYFNKNQHDESGAKQWVISGVFQDIPHNSHLPQLRLLIPMKPVGPYSEDAWSISQEATYVKVTPNTNVLVLAKEINQIAGQHDSGREATYEYFVQPLRDIHLYSDFMWEYATLGNLDQIIAFSIIAILILGIACLNFINLSTAQSSMRAKEIGVRKVVGARRNAIIRQFIVESLLTALVALCVAIILVEILLPVFNTYLGKELRIGYYSDPTFIISAVLIVVFVGFMASIVPAFFMASFKPTTILKGTLPVFSTTRGDASIGKKHGLRNALVVSQFVISLTLIISSLFVYRQVSFMKNKDLGFHKDQMLVVPSQSVKMSQTIYNEFESIKSEFMQHHSVVSVTIQVAAPGRDKLTEKIRLLDKVDAEGIFSCIEFCDSDYMNTYEIPVIAGHNYQKNRTTDKGETFIINETATKALGFSSPQDAINQRMSAWFWKGEIIGVVKDFHFASLHEKIGPLVTFTPKFNPEYFTIRLNTQNMVETLSFLKEKWAAFFPHNPFDYYFLDEDLANFYQAEEKLCTLIFIFTGLAIFIACLGLFGLASFTTVRRTKEIGIRKVLGASVSGIMVMLSTEFIKWVVFANILAWPIAWYVMNKWLQNFAYRIEMRWWVFVLAGIVALLIALVTVSWQGIRAASANPVEALRYE